MHFGAPLAVLRWWWRGRREPGYRVGLGERFGRPPPGVGHGSVWIHAVSVGEAQVAVRLLLALRQAGCDLPVLVTTTTPAGRARLRALLPPDVAVGWAPLDLPWVVGRFLGAVEPSALVLVETELWPGWIAACARRSTPVMLVNARLSARAARRYRRLGGFGRRMFAGLGACACTAAPDARRFEALGVSASRVRVIGNIKFDAVLPPPAAGLESLPPVSMIGSSTHAGEDDVLLSALATLRQRQPQARLVLAPRHPTRAGQVLAAARAAGFVTVLRSEWDSGQLFDVLVLDTLGELAGILSRARVVFVGGTLVPVGGHSPIEAALAGVPAVCGPHIFKIEALSEQLAAAGALVVAPDAAAVSAALVSVVQDSALHASAAGAARAAADSGRGAARRAAQWLQGLLSVSGA